MDYSLPDAHLLEDAVSYINTSGEKLLPYFSLLCFIPAQACLVIGQSNKPELSIHLELAAADGIPVYKRPTGGEAVFLSPHTWVLSFAVAAGQIVKSSIAFNWILEKISIALAKQGIQNVKFNGISDLSIDNKKILGCSIYRRPHLLFYHAILNLAEQPELIGKYLLPPSREPDYRQNRIHSDFVTSLSQSGYNADTDKLESDIKDLCHSDWTQLITRV